MRIIIVFVSHDVLIPGSNKITGSIPRQMGELTSLNSLVFGKRPAACVTPLFTYSFRSNLFLSFFETADNRLTGTIPSMTGNLKTVQFVEFSESDLILMTPACFTT